LESYRIPDSAVTASSFLNIHNEPENARLHFQMKCCPVRYGSWTAKGAFYRDDSWWQVDFGSWTKVTAVATQGRHQTLWWVERYRLSYSYDGLFFKDYMEGGSYPKVL